MLTFLRETGIVLDACVAYLANRLARLPTEIAIILVVLLPKVGAVANLNPQDDDRSNGYADDSQGESVAEISSRAADYHA